MIIMIYDYNDLWLLWLMLIMIYDYYDLWLMRLMINNNRINLKPRLKLILKDIWLLLVNIFNLVIENFLYIILNLSIFLNVYILNFGYMKDVLIKKIVIYIKISLINLYYKLYLNSNFDKQQWKSFMHKN